MRRRSETQWLFSTRGASAYGFHLAPWSRGARPGRPAPRSCRTAASVEAARRGPAPRARLTIRRRSRSPRLAAANEVPMLAAQASSARRSTVVRRRRATRSTCVPPDRAARRTCSAKAALATRAALASPRGSRNAARQLVVRPTRPTGPCTVTRRRPEDRRANAARRHLPTLRAPPWSPRPARRSPASARRAARPTQTARRRARPSSEEFPAAMVVPTRAGVRRRRRVLARPPDSAATVASRSREG
jgi:hypothetical protein